MVPFWGRCTTHFRTYFSGGWDVHWGYDLDLMFTEITIWILTHGHLYLSVESIRTPCVDPQSASQSASPRRGLAPDLRAGGAHRGGGAAHGAGGKGKGWRNGGCGYPRNGVGHLFDVAARGNLAWVDLLFTKASFS